MREIRDLAREDEDSGESSEPKPHGEEAKPADKPKGKERKPKTGKQAKLMKLFAELLAHIEAKTGVKIVRETGEQIRKSAEQAQSGKFKSLKDGRLQLPAQEYAIVRSAIAEREYVFGNEKQYGYVFSANNFYVYTRADIHNQIVEFGLPIETNRERINALIEKIENGTLRDPRSARKYIKGFKRGGRGDNGGGSVPAEERGRNGGLGDVRDGEQSDEQADNGEDRGTSLFLTGESSVGDVVSPTDSDLKFRQGGYMDGGAWSYRANEALNRGLRPAAMIAKDFGTSIEAVEYVLRSDEWHHVGKDFEEVYFYDTDDVAVEAPDAISDADDARRFKNVVRIKNWETRPEPRKFGGTDAKNEYYATFVHTRTRADKQAYDAEDAFDEAIESYENGELDLAGLKKAAEQFEKDYAAGIKAKKEAVKAFLAKHKDWKRPSKRRAKIGMNGLRYLSRDGVVYGYFDPVRKELHLNEDFADFDTPIHEWTHVWWSWVSEQDSRLTDKIVDLVKRLKAFKSLKAEAENPKSVYHGLDDAALAQEVFSRLVGERGEELITKSEKSVWAKLKEYAQASFKEVLRSVRFA